MIQVKIVNGPIEFFPSDNDRQKDGAELVFNGRVRDIEHGEKITSLEYEQYDGMAEAELKQLADEIRDALCSLLNQRTAHFASNLGVVELCLALHSVFDFRHAATAAQSGER